MFIFALMPTIFGIIIFGVIVRVVITVAKKHGEITKNITTTMMGSFESENKIEEVKDKPNYCDYCGSVIEKDKRKCPNCGAKLKK